MLDGVKCYVEKVLGRIIGNMCLGWFAILKEVIRENLLDKVTFEQGTEGGKVVTSVGHLLEEHSGQKE